MNQKIDSDDVPELSDAFWATATVVTPPQKKPITIRIDDDVLTFFKTTSPKYQTKINTVLRRYMQAQKVH